MTAGSPSASLTAWSPALRKVNSVVTMADMPEENRRVPAAPSKLVITLAAASTVGLPQRLYRYPSWWTIRKSLEKEKQLVGLTLANVLLKSSPSLALSSRNVEAEYIGAVKGRGGWVPYELKPPNRCLQALYLYAGSSLLPWLGVATPPPA